MGFRGRDGCHRGEVFRGLHVPGVFLFPGMGPRQRAERIHHILVVPGPQHEVTGRGQETSSSRAAVLGFFHRDFQISSAPAEIRVWGNGLLWNSLNPGQS